MTPTEQRQRVKQFVARWTERGYEKGESQTFWLDLLALLDVESPADFIRFETQVHLDHTAFIDGFIPKTHVLIEQKSLGKDLRAPIRQSDGSLLTPFQQAKRYAAELPYSERPRWIVTCNFEEFLVYDMEQPNGEPAAIRLCDLERELYRLHFLVHTEDTTLQREMALSLAAGELVGRLYDALLAQYIDPTSPATLHSLNALCVRLVFCLYAEDAGLFGSHTAFHDYLASFSADNVRRGLIDLFEILDTKPEDRDPYAEPALLAFPYVNGGLFADKQIEIPRFTPEILHLLLQDCSADFDWSGISPTIFGAVFESTLNPETRRSGGMHYTSIENIHRVIDPLFLADLEAELAALECPGASPRTRGGAQERLRAFHEKLSRLRFLDPACGSGNFLTETFLSLRRLENRVLKLLRGGDTQLQLGGDFSPIKVSIAQFYGIEINDFAATVAKTALWIAESQMMRETEDIVGHDLNFLPLKTYTNITEGNALRLDWRSVLTGKSNDLSALHIGEAQGRATLLSPQGGDIAKRCGEAQGGATLLSPQSGDIAKRCGEAQGGATLLSPQGGDIAKRCGEAQGGATLLSPQGGDIAKRCGEAQGGATLLSPQSDDITKRCGEAQGGATLLSPQSDDAQKSLLEASDTFLADIFLNREGEIKRSKNRRLPHWHQDGKLQFITYRLADAMPQSLIDEWRLEKNEWDKRHPLPWDDDTERDYHERFSRQLDKWLDAGYGSCVLRHKEIATCVEESLRHYDGERYRLLAYVIMPNHVHVLVETQADYDTAKLVKAWKGVAARRINQILNQSGELWQKEYYDKIIRDEAHLSHVVNYIEHNYATGGVARYMLHEECDEENNAQSTDTSRLYAAMGRQECRPSLGFAEEVRTNFALGRQECRPSLGCAEDSSEDLNSTLAAHPLYIMGNPPFVGARLMSKEQKDDMLHVFGAKWKNVGNMDYVCCWYKKAVELMHGTSIHAALVSTNSITQGEQVPNLWRPLFEHFHVRIDFAHRTFRWDNEASLKAHVHCVIVGFSTGAGADATPSSEAQGGATLLSPTAISGFARGRQECRSSLGCAEENRAKYSLVQSAPVIYDGDVRREAAHINAYLIDAPDVFVESRSKPLCDVPEIGIGNKPIDGGNYLFKREEMEAFLKREPSARDYFKPWYGAEEFIHRCPRYCLWLGSCTPAQINAMPECKKRVAAVREFRLASKSEGTRKLADRPTHFHVENMPAGNYIVVPKVSSERRRYVPMGFFTPDIFCSDLVFIIPNATLYHFGILTSNVHMAWMRAVCGRLKSDYRYSKDVVYNNFPWPLPTDAQRAKIEQTAQAILDARAQYPTSSLADLYDEVTMPPELRRAHQQNDRAVMEAYGFTPIRDYTETACAAALMARYQALTARTDNVAEAKPAKANKGV